MLRQLEFFPVRLQGKSLCKFGFLPTGNCRLTVVLAVKGVFEMSKDWLMQVTAKDTGVLIAGAGNVVAIHYMPQLTQLYARSSLPEKFFILLVSRTSKREDGSPQTSETIRDDLKHAVQHAQGEEFSEPSWERFSQRIYYLSADLTKIEQFPKCIAELARLAEKHGTGGNLIINLAVPTPCYDSIIRNLRETGLSDGLRESRLTGASELSLPPGDRIALVEKPIGRDLAEVRRNDALLDEVFPPDSTGRPRVYRIDHYLFKEMVSGILAVRSANPFLVYNPRNTRRFEAATTKVHGVEGRLAYEGEGADMFQHLLLSLAFAAAPEPKNGDASELWDNIESFLRSCKPADPDIRKCSIRGRYKAGVIGRKPQLGYVDEVMADEKLSDAQKAERSNLETFAGFRFKTDMWPDTSFVVYSGKNLPERTSGIWVISNPVTSRFAREQVHNQLYFELGPDPGMELLANFKRPGSRLILTPGSLKLDPTKLEGHPLDGYGMLWNHTFRGLDYLFPRSGAMEASAELADPVIQYWRNSGDEGMCDYVADMWPDKLEETLGNCSLVDYSKGRE